ncbi:MAG: N-acetyltransferase family protein [Burkholderiales bacterium]
MSASEEFPGRLTIRASAPTDVGAIAAIYAHHVRNGLASFEIVPPDDAEIARRRDSTLARGLPYLVAELDRRIAGYAYAAPYRERPAYRYTLEDSVYIDPAAARQGIGRALLDALVVSCAALGYRQLIAVIGDSANAASIGLHEACGFARTGLLPSVGFKVGRWVDSVLMQRALGSGDTVAPDEG